MSGKRLTTTERGLGADHQRRRRELLPHAYGKPCPKCGQLMLPGQPLDLDHTIPRALGGTGGPVRMVHRRCNRRDGARLGNQMRWGGRRKASGHAFRSRW